jgi:uncharacterized protein
MAEHPNVTRMRDGYAAFAKGDFEALNDLFAEDVRWHERGRNQLAGDYDGRDAVYGMFGRLMELTEGSFHIDVQALLADDDHAVAVVTETASRGGRRAETFGAHIFRMRDGMVVEFWESSTDQYAMDEVLG